MIDQQTITAIVKEPTGNFVKLAELLGLDARNAGAWVGMDLTGCDFSGCKLDGYNFTRCTMRGIRWDDDTDFTGAKTLGASFDDGVRGTLKGLPVEKLYRVIPASHVNPEPIKAPNAEEALAFFRRRDRPLRMAQLMVRAIDPPDAAWEWVLT
jgi:hypothetical protein